MTITHVHLDDLDEAAATPAATALANLRDVHNLPAPYAVVEASGGALGDRSTVVVSVPPAAAEDWRAALAAPAFARVDDPTTVKFSTVVMWFGTKIQLTFISY
jgi:hypothetical protein